MSILTKVFVLMQLVFALVLCVLVVLFVNGQQNYKKQVLTTQNAMYAASAALASQEATVGRVESQLTAAMRANTRMAGNLNDQILTLQGKVSSAQAEIAQLKATNQSSINSNSLLSDANRSLEKQLANETHQLNKLRPSTLRYINENAQLNRHNDQLTNERNEAQKQIQTLQESLAALNMRLTKALASAQTPASGSSVSSLIGTPTAVAVNGHVQQVQTYNNRTYVSVSLGARDGVVKGTRLTVYRGGKYIADLLVRSVDPTTSVGMVTLVTPGQKVMANDMVMSGPGT